MPQYERAPDEVFELMEELVTSFHPMLRHARIDLLFRDEAPTSKGKVTLGKAAKISAEWQFYVPFDFKIWLAKDFWEVLTWQQQRALLDHELSHCKLLNGEYTTVDHDVEEFIGVLQRNGLWWDGSEAFRAAIRPHFAFYSEIEPVAVEAPVNNRDVLAQVDGMLNGNGAGAAGHHEPAAEEEDEDQA